LFFFFTDTSTTDLYTLSLHDALPILSESIYRVTEFVFLKLVRQHHSRGRVAGCYEVLKLIARVMPAAGRIDHRAIRHWAKERFSDRKSTRLNSSHVEISYAVFCLKKK